MHGELLERVVERDNLRRALKQVRRNKGAPGIDGMSVDELPRHLVHHWLQIKADILAGRYRPQPVRRVEIPKPDGRKRMLGIPTVLDRFIQQAIAQIVQAQWEPHFHPDSYGFRPKRSAHQAVRKLQADVKDGHDWVVDLDLESFFDRVNHDRLLHRLRQHVEDQVLLRLIMSIPGPCRCPAFAKKRRCSLPRWGRALFTPSPAGGGLGVGARMRRPVSTRCPHPNLPQKGEGADHDGTARVLFLMSWWVLMTPRCADCAATASA